MNFNLDKSIPLFDFITVLNPKVVPQLTKKYHIKKVITDTRNYSSKGGIFFAIKGKKFDGHQFIPQIIKNIDFVVVSDKNAIIEKYKQKFIVVDDTIKAFCKLASLYKSQFQNLKIITVCGSNGKTTTKELIKSILSKTYNVVATVDNQNNLIGTSYTLFSITRKTQCCVLELGISLPEEMDVLGDTTTPDVCVITNIGKEHLEFLKSQEKVFVEETKIIKYVKKYGMLVLNGNDVYLKKVKWDGTIKWYGFNNNKQFDVYPEKVNFTTETTEISIIVKDTLGLKFRLPTIKTKLIGVYNVYNILAAVCCSFFYNLVDPQIIVDTISEFEPVENRGRRFYINNNIIIDESYNANPDSMKITINEFLKIFSGKEIVLVLGDMLELGEHSIAEHKNLKNFIDFEKIKYLFLIGENIKILYNNLNNIEKIKTKYYFNKEELLNDLTNLVFSSKNLAILFKASHAVGLSEIVNKLCSLEKKY